MSGASERANGGANGPVLYALISYHLNPLCTALMYSFQRLLPSPFSFRCLAFFTGVFHKLSSHFCRSHSFFCRLHVCFPDFFTTSIFHSFMFLFSPFLLLRRRLHRRCCRCRRPFRRHDLAYFLSYHEWMISVVICLS